MRVEQISKRLANQTINLASKKDLNEIIKAFNNAEKIEKCGHPICFDSCKHQGKCNFRIGDRTDGKRL